MITALAQSLRFGYLKQLLSNVRIGNCVSGKTCHLWKGNRKNLINNNRKSFYGNKTLYIYLYSINRNNGIKLKQNMFPIR